ncbi:hypothetical protein ES705_45247 [subsurface metagenome]
MPQYPSAAELQRQRKSALREVRRRQRAADSSMERLERRLFALIDRKTLISPESALTLIPLWNDLIKGVRDVENGITDFISITNI